MNAAPPSMPTTKPEPSLGTEINRAEVARSRKPKKEKTPKAPRAKRTPEEQRAQDVKALARAEQKAAKLKAKLDGKLAPKQLMVQCERAIDALEKILPSVAGYGMDDKAIKHAIADCVNLFELTESASTIEYAPKEPTPASA